MTPQLIPKNYPTEKILKLIQEAFAEQNGHIDPPSSMHLLTVQDIETHAANQFIWIVESGDNLEGCIFGALEADALYLSKLSVAQSARCKGLARQLIDTAATYAYANQIKRLTLISRIELVENHAIFAKLGFKKTHTGSHPGYDRPTEIHFEKQL